MNQSDITDEGLMAEIRAGSADAFAALVRRYQRSLLNLFRRMGARVDEAEDLSQETFLRVFGYRERYRPSGKFRSFLFVLARHAWADRARRAIRRPESPGLAAELSADPSGDRTERSDARMDVTAALRELSEKLREVVVLSVLQGLEYREVADVLEIPVGTVKSRMHLAMRRLREVLGVGTTR